MIAKRKKYIYSPGVVCGCSQQNAIIVTCKKPHKKQKKNL